MPFQWALETLKPTSYDAKDGKAQVGVKVKSRVSPAHPEWAYASLSFIVFVRMIGYGPLDNTGRVGLIYVNDIHLTFGTRS